MKRLLVGIGVLCLVGMLLPQLSLAKDYNSRPTNWGMSKEQVKASEPPDIKWEEERDTLGYYDKVLNKRVWVKYSFTANQLFMASYSLIGTYTNNNEFIDGYNDFKEGLTKKYGKPYRDETIWENGLYKNDSSKCEYAISQGYLKYIAEWKTGNTIIYLTVLGNNYEVKCFILYYEDI